MQMNRVIVQFVLLEIYSADSKIPAIAQHSSLKLFLDKLQQIKDNLLVIREGAHTSLWLAY